MPMPVPARRAGRCERRPGQGDGGGRPAPPRKEEGALLGPRRGAGPFAAGRGFSGTGFPAAPWAARTTLAHAPSGGRGAEPWPGGGGPGAAALHPARARTSARRPRRTSPTGAQARPTQVGRRGVRPRAAPRRWFWGEPRAQLGASLSKRRPCLTGAEPDREASAERQPRGPWGSRVTVWATAGDGGCLQAGWPRAGRTGGRSSASRIFTGGRGTARGGTVSSHITDSAQAPPAGRRPGCTPTLPQGGPALGGGWGACPWAL